MEDSTFGLCLPKKCSEKDGQNILEYFSEECKYLRIKTTRILFDQNCFINRSFWEGEVFREVVDSSSTVASELRERRVPERRDRLQNHIV